MPNNGNGSGVAIALFTGLAIGAIFGILFAPKSGQETRNELVENSERLMDMGKKSVSDVVEKTNDLAESGKKKIEELKAVVK